MKTIKKAKLVLIGLIIVFCLAIMIALSYGQINISFITVIKVLSQEFGFINNHNFDFVSLFVTALLI